MNETLESFQNWPVERDHSPRTVFTRWFTQTNGQSLTPETLSPTDVREYRQWMVTTRGMAPATANRRIAALRAYTSWARSTGLIAGTPTNGIKFKEVFVGRQGDKLGERAIQRVHILSPRHSSVSAAQLR